MVTRLKNRVERLFNTRGVHRKGPLFYFTLNVAALTFTVFDY